MATIRDIAARAGVSTCTVSKILSGGRNHERYSADCRERVQAAAQALSFTPNRVAHALRTGATGILAFALDWAPVGAGNGFQAAMISACESAARRRGLHLLVVGARPGGTAIATALDLVARRQCDGIVIPGGQITRTQLATIRRTGAPVAFLGQVPPGCAGGELDDAAGLVAAVDHLAGLGHRRLAWIEIADSDRAEVRRAGFTTACAEGRLDGLPLRLPAYPDAGEDEARVAHVCARLLAERDALADRTALVCYHDLTAIGAYAAMAALGRRVPDEVAVVGFDNVHAATALPALTTIDHELPALAEAAMAALRDGRGLTQVTPRLIERASTAHPANA